jgi:hypothetical protein
MNAAYTHPEGGSIDLTETTLTVMAENGHAASIQIGPDGLRELAKKLKAHAADFEYAMHLEGLSNNGVFHAKRKPQKSGTPAQLESMSDHEYLHHISNIKPIVKVNTIRQRPTIKNLGEVVQEVCRQQPLRGGTKISAYSEADYNGINHEEPDQIELTIEGDTLMLGCSNAVEIHIRENASVNTVRAILKAVRQELKSWPGLESVTPLVPVSDDSVPF